ncbi:hypothetical protein Ae201684P_008386 [Aphanomyces euteiches]|uniref:Reverse transcriptase n=1 Tax=Aphanomyces euteiches TaxID=100861 RepID=A0A6G0XQJ2_9STRA|nr:hypothetical protein Ae201684_002477 [Aphanomyces euteiches]KAH9092717.1 hypothetical protein Ae201684P_008386 [Aphanomyces euteiches]
MLDELMHALEQDHQEWVLTQEGKVVVDVMAKAIKPYALRIAVQKQLQLQKNKALKSDVFRFVKWLRQYAAGFQMYVGLDETPTPTVAPKGEAQRAGRGDGGSRGDGRAKPYAGAKGEGKGGTAAKPAAEKSKEDAKPKKKLGCLKCSDASHRVADCPMAAPGEAQKLLDAQLKKWREAVQVLGDMPERRRTDRGAMVEALVRVDNVLLDTGADVNVVSRGVMDALAAKGASVAVATHDKPRQIYPYGADATPLEMRRSVKFTSVTFETACGPLTLRGLQAWVDDTSSLIELIISRPVMEVLGFSVDDLLVGARQPNAGIIQRLMADGRESDEPQLDESDGMECATPAVERPAGDGRDEERRKKKEEAVLGILMSKVADAQARGLTAEETARLESLLSRHVDVFREDLGNDPPVKVEPLKVRVKPDSKPVKCAMRRYPPAHLEYMREHVAALEANGMVYKNNRATWAAAPRIVPKRDAGALRMTIDSRPINACTEPMPWPMPNLDSAMACLVGTKAYFTLDWTKGYWQLPLHADSQEFFSFMTPFGVYTPTRVLMGQTDAVAYCQSVVHQMFGELLFRELLAWLDDLLGSAKSVASLFDLLDQVLATCAEFGLKLSPKKCHFYMAEAEWCGKIISAAGVTHSPRRIQGLIDLALPTTAADLQQFVCATNWMRASITDNNKLIDPLRRLLDVAVKAAGSSKKKALARVALSLVGWSQDHAACFEDAKSALANVVPLSHPRSDLEVCVFTDASDKFWGAVATQIPSEDLSLPLEDQRHKPLAFLSGTFTGASQCWPIVEKEAYAVVESCKRLDYLVVRPGGFRLFTDHRNLAYMFNPRGSNSGMAKYQADKLQRWALVMSTFPYTIECLPGDTNVWGDLLSRWGSAQSSRTIARVRKLLQNDFEWPTAKSILEAHKLAIERGGSTPPSVAWSNEDSFHIDDQGRIWVPDDAVDLQQRLCVIAHQGAAGHRRVAATVKSVSDKFWWATLAQDVETFVKACLHCMQVDGDVVPRPLGSALHAEKPNELIHFDWLSMPMSTSGLKHVLVIKDDMSGFVHLFPAESADATSTATALMGWFTLCGCVETWVADDGSHFKNEVVEKIRKIVGAHHHITTAYSLSANGTVEVVNRLILRAVRAF